MGVNLMEKYKNSSSVPKEVSLILVLQLKRNEQKKEQNDIQQKRVQYTKNFKVFVIITENRQIQEKVALWLT